MLTPLKGKEDIDVFFVVADIECYAKPHPREGELIAIDTAWREESGADGKPGAIKHQRHFDWGEWWSWIVDISEMDKRFRTIYAHNGGGYDWISFVQFSLLEGRKRRERLSAACSGSKMVTVNVSIQNGHSIHLCDSLQLLRSKLDDLATVFTGKGKADTGGKLPHELWEGNASDRTNFHRYHERDTEILLEVMEKALILVRDKVAKIDSFGYTIGSTAMKVFRTVGMDREIAVPTDAELREFLRSGYKGGRVECFAPGVYENISVYDVNSLYPFAMKSVSVPVSDRGLWGTDYESDSVSVAEIEFRQHDRTILPVLLENGNGVYSGRGVYFSPEIDLLKSVDPHARIKFLRVFRFVENDKIFESFVDRLYALRLKYPDTEEKKSPISLLAKYLLNSLYGKFGQHAERESIEIDGDLDLEELVKGGHNEVRLINPRLGVCGVMHETRCNFEHVGIAGIITSFARVILYRGLLSAGRENVVYCDTDSVHTRKALDSRLVGSHLGLFKLECQGRGAYAGKKLYAIRPPVGKEKIRVKGVSVGGRFGARITFRDMEKIVSGKHKVCRFKQFATPLEVMTEKSRAGVLRDRKRTIRRLK